MLSRDGPKNIEDIEVGDYVLAFDEETGENKYCEVVDVFRNTVDTLVDLTIRDEEGEESVISGTPEHPFYVPAVGDYVNMGELEPGTVLQTPDCSLAVVVGCETRHGVFPVYNFEVAGAHNYHVAAPEGETPVYFVLVHNACKPGWAKDGWGKNRMQKEMFDNGFSQTGPTRSGGGRIWKNPATGEEIRIMPSPNRPPFRGESWIKFQNDNYFRYRTGPDQPWGSHQSLINP